MSAIALSYSVSLMILPTLMLLTLVSTAPDGAELYAKAVKPVLARRCVSCHGALKHKAGLRLDSAAAILHGGESGPAVTVDRVPESLLIERVTSADRSSRMPPEGEPLQPEEIAAIRSWIESGAKAPEGETAPADPRDHWAFRSPVRPGVPDTIAGANPIDAFLGAEHRRIGLAARPRADKAELFRRVNLDLAGLAGSPDASRAFIADPSPDAYDKLVDRLLASPQFGERWGRHWMDVWRYSDWDGFAAEIRESRPFIWHWRDWIVESLNRDLGYDRMIVLMLAADEAAPEDDSSLRATGFLARNWDKFSRVRWLDNSVEHTAKAFLGLTIACARCHDHKYDPIAQTDYYRFRAFFEPHETREDRLPLGPEAARDGVPRAFDSRLGEPTYLFVRGDDGRPDKTKAIAPGVPDFLTKAPVRPTPVPIPARRDIRCSAISSRTNCERGLRKPWKPPSGTSPPRPPGDRPIAELSVLVAGAAQRAISARIVADEARAFDPTGPDTRQQALLGQARGSGARSPRGGASAGKGAGKRCRPRGKPGARTTTRRRPLFRPPNRNWPPRQRPSRQRSRTPRRPPSITRPLAPVYPAESTGRRLALAKWIAAPENPLTARVAVNHVWARHFGRPLVGNMFDFGLNGHAPANPALLDWLATELVHHGWSLKHLHRLIVTSDAYTRQSTHAGPRDPNLVRDPDNLHYWRMNARRMEAELVRDNLLSTSGMLDSALGGPDIDPAVAMVSRRRSLYLRHAQEKRAVFLKVFDSPSANDCYRRIESVMPQQALALANSPLAIHAARRLASRTLERLRLRSAIHRQGVRGGAGPSRHSKKSAWPVSSS